MVPRLYSDYSIEGLLHFLSAQGWWGQDKGSLLGFAGTDLNVQIAGRHTALSSCLWVWSHEDPIWIVAASKTMKRKARALQRKKKLIPSYSFSEPWDNLSLPLVCEKIKPRCSRWVAITCWLVLPQKAQRLCKGTKEVDLRPPLRQSNPSTDTWILPDKVSISSVSPTRWTCPLTKEAVRNVEAPVLAHSQGDKEWKLGTVPDRRDATMRVSRLWTFDLCTQ